MRALQLAGGPQDRRDHCREIPDQPPVIIEVGTTRVAQQRRRSRGNAPACQVGVNDRQLPRIRQRPSDRCGPMIGVGFRCDPRSRLRRVAGTDYFVDLVAGGL